MKILVILDFFFVKKNIFFLLKIFLRQIRLPESLVDLLGNLRKLPFIFGTIPVYPEVAFDLF